MKRFAIVHVVGMGGEGYIQNDRRSDLSCKGKGMVRWIDTIQ